MNNIKTDDYNATRNYRPQVGGVYRAIWEWEKFVSSPFLYNNTMYTMAGLVTAASALHFMVRPVDKKHFEPEKKE